MVEAQLILLTLVIVFKINDMKKLSFIFFTIVSIVFNSCVTDADFTIPENLNLAENNEVLKIEEALQETNSGIDAISIKGLKKLFVRGKAVEITSDIVLVGYVASSDRKGNFFKELYIQDSAENAENGIRVVLDVTNTHNKYNLGRKVYIKLKGLFVGETRFGDGVITIGKKEENLVTAISFTQIDDFIFRATETRKILPRKTQISEVNEDFIGTLIQLDNVQFLEELIINGLSFADSKERFDTERLLESCSSNKRDTIILETSSFASFKFFPLPKQQFTMQAIVAKTFNGSNLVLVLNDKTAIVETGSRCN